MKKLLLNYKTDIIATYQLALPIIAGQLGIMLMGFADTVQVGRMDKGAVEALAASADANGMTVNIAIIGYICLQIVAPMVSKAQAGNDFVECKRLLKANITVSFLMSLVCSLILLFVSFNLEITKQPAEIRTLTKEYLWIIIISTIPSFVFTSIKSFTDGLGFANLSMKITLSALILNVILNHCFIHGIWFFPAWGLNGAGVATLIARTYMALMLAYFTFKTDTFKVYLQIKEPIGNVNNLVKNILKIGITSGFQGFFEIAAFYGAVVMMGWISIQHKAAHLVAINYVALTYMAATGIASAGGIRVGASLGEKNRANILKAGTTALGIGFVFMAICTFFLLIFNVEFASYVKDEQVIILAAELIIWGGFFQLFDGIQAVSLGILRGIQDVNIPTLITVFAYWGVGLPMSYVLGFHYEMKHIGIWIGLTLALFASASLLSWRFYNKVKRMDL